MLHWCLVTHSFQSRRRHGWFKYDLTVKEAFGPPDRCLGANVERLQLKNGWVVWSSKYVDYLKIMLDSINNSLGMDNTEIKNYGDGHSPYSSRFRPELNIAEELG